MTPLGQFRPIDLAKSALCFLASCAWVGIGLRFVSDTPAGALVLLVPAFIILGVGAYFYARGRGLFGGGGNDV